MCLLCFYRFSELLEAVLGDFLLNGRCDGSRDMPIEFQFHTKSHITLWLPVLIPVSGPRGHFLSQQQLIRELNGKKNITFKMTSQSLKLLGGYSDSFNLSNAVELSRS